jgi:dynein intermediate chain, cytosolic
VCRTQHLYLNLSFCQIIQLSLVTASADGRLNFWSMTNLRDPAESIQVGDSISCFAVLPESDTLVVGDEHGTMYSVASPNAAATSSGDTNTASSSSGKNSPVPPTSTTGGGQRVSRRQVKKMDMSGDDDNHLGHYGMITSISAKLRSSSNSNKQAPQSSQNIGATSKGFFRGISGLLVSSGVDWTVKLWGPAYHNDKPLISYVSHSYDYMSDVAWSTTHPSLFAAASSNGSVGLWNLAKSLDEPITGPEGIIVQPDAMSSGVGLNKIKWSADGRRLAVASSDKVHMLHLSDEVTRTKGDEETKVMNQLLARGLI